MTVTNTILQIKYARIISILSNTMCIPIEDAMQMFYKSMTFRFMGQKSTGLYTMSDKYLAEEIMLENSSTIQHFNDSTKQTCPLQSK